MTTNHDADGDAENVDVDGNADGAADNDDSSDYKVSLANLIDNGRRVAKVARLWLIMQSNNQPVGRSIYKQAVSLSVMCCVF